ncbi:MFS transporter [Acinetobacter apis]|uniref:MFS transporter, putative metabolite:H+ symporter n=1 Tax=Acinetobacter apis TaxID=1229165 RepID=A0A217EHM6_9GAMM|nr:MFS transporter [Acinetobacter apis]SNQ29993.1 MFS transporter, putative metabolite:H+ symporter [Acinetobacter apis]
MDLMARVQRLPVGKFHYTLLWVVGLGWMFDAMDTGIIAFILTILVKDWQLTATQSGFIVSISFVGMALGAIASGALADRFGRKALFMLTLAIYSLATAACAFAPNLTWLLVCRFVVGIGLGGQLPVAVTLVSEYIPAQVRGRFIVLLESFWGLGWLVAALVSYFIIPKFSWHVAFLIGGLPIFYLVVIWFKVPESIPYLIQQGKTEAAHRILQKLERQAGLPVEQQIQIRPMIEPKKAAFVQLWSKKFVRRTVMLWLIWFGIVFSYYGIFTWLPSLLVKQGFDVVKSFEYVLFMILAQLPGYVVASWLVEKLGRKATLAGLMAGCAICAYFFGQAASNQSIMLWGCFMSFFNLGAWGVLYTYTPEQYPTNIRAFGSGWASAIGRIGGISAPMVVTYMMTFEHAFSQIFMMFAAVLLAIALTVLILGEETKGKSIESIGL